MNGIIIISKKSLRLTAIVIFNKEARKLHIQLKIIN